MYKLFLNFQSGGECLRAYVSVGPDQICHFTDAEGKSGLWYMVQVAGHLLNPVGSEFSATFVGRLVTTLIQVNIDKISSSFSSKIRWPKDCTLIKPGPNWKLRILTWSKGQLILKANCQAVNSSKNEQMNSFLLQCDVFSSLFWKKLKTPKRHFEIIWPLK